MFKKLFFLFIISMSLIISNPVSAQTSIISPDNSNYKNGDYQVNDILSVAIGVTKIILGIVGSLTLLMFIYGGFTFLISAGSSEKIAKAKGIIVAAVIGLLIVFASFIIIKFVLQALGRNDFDGNIMSIKASASNSSNQVK